MDRQLLEQLYHAYYQELYIYVYSLCKNRELAEDILQETFLKAILSLPKGHTNLRAWLYKVARNLALNTIKRDNLLQKKQRDISDISKEDFDEPLAKLIKKEQYRELYRAMNSLDQKKREVLILQYFGRLSQKEIAAVLRMTPENVRVTASRARRELRTYMEGKENDLP